MRRCDGTCDTCNCEIWSPRYVERTHIERVRARLRRWLAISQHVGQCQKCQQILKVGLSSRAALNGYLLWHAGVAEGNSQDGQ